MGQVRGNPPNDTVPVTGGWLTIEPDGGIPGAVVAVAKPAPARIEPIQDPHGFPQCPRQVCHRRVDADDEIQVLYEGRRVRKVLEFGRVIDEARTEPVGCRQTRQLRFRRLTFLQAVKVHRRVFQRTELGEREVATLIHGPRLG
jgi:hypothetical protein